MRSRGREDGLLPKLRTAARLESDLAIKSFRQFAPTKFLTARQQAVGLRAGLRGAVPWSPVRRKKQNTGWKNWRMFFALEYEANDRHLLPQKEVSDVTRSSRCRTCEQGPGLLAK